MTYTYIPKGVCSRKIDLTIEDGVIRNVKFSGGCSGNTQGVALLANGRPADELIHLLRGVHCGFRPTSCPDQFARALEKALEETGKKA